MRITVYAIGKKHDMALAAAITEYTDRISRTVGITWEFLPASGLPEQQARQEETTALLKRIPANDIVWLLDETGVMIDSPQLATKVAAVQQTGRNLSFVIGGAYGVADDLHNRADFVWSLSKLVFPHQLVRLIVSEQLYRAYEINRGSGYHHQ